MCHTCLYPSQGHEIMIFLIQVISVNLVQQDVTGERLPSSEEERMARPLWVNARPVTAALCSEKVTKQNDDWEDHTLTCNSYCELMLSS